MDVSRNGKSRCEQETHFLMRPTSETLVQAAESVWNVIARRDEIFIREFRCWQEGKGWSILTTRNRSNRFYKLK